MSSSRSREERAARLAHVGFATISVALLSACGVRSEPRAPEPPTLEAWRAARGRLAAIRTSLAAPRTLRIGLKLREPVTGRVLEARGAVAIAPPRSLRMILVGPGG